MKAVLKKAIALLLLSALFLSGCAKTPAPAPEVSATAAPTLAPTPTPTATATATPTPTATPSPTPTATPSPTPTPTPTPSPTPTAVPLERRDLGSQVEQQLLPLLSCSPEPTPTVAPLATPNPYVEYIGQLGAMTFAHVPIHTWASDTSYVLGRESYHLFYIHNLVNRQYYRVTTQEGLTGFMKATQCAPLSEEDLARYFAAVRETQRTVDFYSPEALIRELQTGEDTGSMAERIYAVLCRLGMDFDPYYYRLYQKELDNDERYPLFYKDPVYNSLLFKLFNSTGSLIYYDGHPTQWEYVPVDGGLRKGDILFFTEPLEKGSSGVLDGYEFVMKGPYSGMLTGCGVYMGKSQVLLLRGGQVKAVPWTKELKATLDSVRRIHTEVFDEKKALIEDLIAQVYDCLGTPYNNFQRKGEFSFDCSGLISWLFMRMEISPTFYGRQLFTGTNASGFSQITEYTWHHQRRIHCIRPIERDEEMGLPSMDQLNRGDIVFLRKEPVSARVGHVMIYLGEGRVIHSTRIDEEYGGTVVAFFRPELQKLYQTAVRIDTISPPKN